MLAVIRVFFRSPSDTAVEALRPQVAVRKGKRLGRF
jgi:hypothetical protein